MATSVVDTKPKSLKRRKSRTKESVPAAMAAESGPEATPADKAPRARKRARKSHPTEKTTEPSPSVEAGGAEKDQVQEEPKKLKRKARKAQALSSTSQVVVAETPTLIEEIKEDGEGKRKKRRKHKAVESADPGEAAPSPVAEEKQAVPEAKEVVGVEQGDSTEGRKKHRLKKKARQERDKVEAAAEAVVEVEKPAAEVATVQPQSASHNVVNDAVEEPKRNKKAKVTEIPSERASQAQKTEDVKNVEGDSAHPGEKKKRTRSKTKSGTAKPAATENTSKLTPPAQNLQPAATGSSSEAISIRAAPAAFSSQPKKSAKPKSPSPVIDPESSDSDVEDAARDGAEMTLNDDQAGSDAEEGGNLYGFSTDDEDSSDDEMAEEWAGLDVAKLPTIAKDDAVVKKKLEKAKRQPTEARGVIFLGRIPHGFYEDQMRSYFTQFGDVTRLRLSRNKTTGRSKHYAFIEFDSSSVAKIVAETMDNYLLMGHILTCKVIPKDEVHPELWIGANKEWKVVPRDRIARVQHNKPRTEEEQAKAEKRLLQRQSRRKRKLDEAGIKYDFDPVAYKKRPKATEA